MKKITALFVMLMAISALHLGGAGGCGGGATGGGGGGGGGATTATANLVVRAPSGAVASLSQPTFLEKMWAFLVISEAKAVLVESLLADASCEIFTQNTDGTETTTGTTVTTNASGQAEVTLGVGSYIAHCTKDNVQLSCPFSIDETQLGGEVSVPVDVAGRICECFNDQFLTTNNCNLPQATLAQACEIAATKAFQDLEACGGNPDFAALVQDTAQFDTFCTTIRNCSVFSAINDIMTGGSIMKTVQDSGGNFLSDVPVNLVCDPDSGIADQTVSTNANGVALFTGLPTGIVCNVTPSLEGCSLVNTATDSVTTNVCGVDLTNEFDCTPPSVDTCTATPTAGQAPLASSFTVNCSAGTTASSFDFTNDGTDDTSCSAASCTGNNTYAAGGKFEAVCKCTSGGVVRKKTIDILVGQPLVEGDIVFASDRASKNKSFDIFSMKSDCSVIQQLTSDDQNDTNPHINEQGTIVYTKDLGAGDTDIICMRFTASGIVETNLTSGTGGSGFSDDFAHLNSDASKVVFYSNRDGDNDVYILSLDSSCNPSGSATNLTNSNTRDDIDPAFDDTGTRIAYSANRNGIDAALPNRFEIFEMNASDGGSVDHLSSTDSGAGDKSQPEYSKDGSVVVYWEDSPPGQLHQVLADAPFTFTSRTPGPACTHPTYTAIASSVVPGDVIYESAGATTQIQQVSTNANICSDPESAASNNIDPDIFKL